MTISLRNGFFINPAWMPAATVRRLVLHWTAGAHIASEEDREHYHFLVEGDGDILRGAFSVTAQHPPLVEGRYAAHTRGANSNTIGVSLCCMAGATERPFSAGRAPMTRVQWDRGMMLVALLCKRYGLPVTSQTVLTHAEVQPTLGIKQNGKWDITRLAFDPSIQGHKAVGDRMRATIVELMK